MLRPKLDLRVLGARFENDSLVVDLMDGRSISAPLAWFPRLLNATPAQRANWQIAGGGYGLHWPDIDEDLSTEGLLRGAPSVEACGRSASLSSDWRKGRGKTANFAEVEEVARRAAA